VGWQQDEPEMANLIIWPSLFELQRRVILSAGLLVCRGRVQREGEVIHLIAEHLIDLSDLLRSVGDRDESFPVPHGRGDEAKHGSGPDARAVDGLGRKLRDSTSPICDSAAGSRSRPGFSVS
jgi:error-prone DNA polymerase